ncbi:MAG: acyl carrier protein [Candidatus Firestonebacteria bacterium]
MTVEERVKKVVARQLKLKEEEIKLESDFVKNLGADSFASIELVAAFEEEFEIEMPEESALQVKTVGKAVEFISKILESKK